MKKKEESEKNTCHSRRTKEGRDPGEVTPPQNPKTATCGNASFVTRKKSHLWEGRNYFFNLDYKGKPIRAAPLGVPGRIKIRAPG